MILRGGSKSFHAIINICLLSFLVILPARAHADHFLSPVPTPSSAYYLVNVKINGISAQVGDEVAFFDPAGVLCGHFLVGTVQEYYPVPVYGDDTTTTIDEGAKAGDVLAVKVWQASSGLEFAGPSLVLTPGTTQGISYAPAPIPPLWQENTGYVLNIDTSAHFPQPQGSPFVSNYIGNLTIKGAPADVGDEIAVFNKRGVLCGSSRITVPGKFGILAVSGDDLSTTIDEGARAGEALTFKVWDKSTGIEYGNTGLSFTPGEPPAGSSFVAANNPPIWSDGAGYVLNIDILTLAPGDINGNGRVDLADAILALKACAGFAPADLSPFYGVADVNGNMKIGLEEVIFILQKIALLR